MELAPKNIMEKEIARSKTSRPSQETIGLHTFKYTRDGPTSDLLGELLALRPNLKEICSYYYISLFNIQCLAKLNVVSDSG